MGKIVGRYLAPHPSMMLESVGKELSAVPERTREGFEVIAEEIKKAAADTLVVVSSHGSTFSNYYNIPDWPKHTGAVQFTRRYIPLSWENDPELVRLIVDKANESGINAASVEGKRYRTYYLERGIDFSISVPLLLLGDVAKDLKIVRIHASNIAQEEHYRFGKALKKAITESGRNVAIIGSGELSHKLHASDDVLKYQARGKNSPQATGESYYGYAVEGEQFDRMVITALRNNDVKSFLAVPPDLREAAWESAIDAFSVVLGSLGGKEPLIIINSYEHPFGIGYVTATIHEGDVSEHNYYEEFLHERHERAIRSAKRESAQAKLARKAIKHYLETEEVMPVPDDLPLELLQERSGVYVTLRLGGCWRGCKGNPLPTKDSVAEEIISAAIKAAFQDGRFNAITAEELENSTIMMSYIGKLEKIKIKKDKHLLDPQEYGLAMRSPTGRWGLVLPRVAKVHNVEEQISAVRSVAGFSFFMGDARIESFRFSTRDFS